MSAISTAYAGLARRRWLTGRVFAPVHDAQEIERLVELDRLAASLPHGQRPQNPRDLHAFLHRLPPIV